MPNERYQKIGSTDGATSSISNENDKLKIQKASVTTNENIDPVVVNSDESLRSMPAKKWFIIGVLCFVNLINYMDRYTIAGVLDDIQKYFNLKDDQGGLLQTAFILSYMVCAPVFGYLGDRYSRRWILIVGIFLWSGSTLLGSFMIHFGWFLAFRAAVGIGEASYSTIAPTIISDLFVNNLRSKMWTIFYFAIPIGSGLGYIVGSEMADVLGSWRWALRVTPMLGVIAVVLIFFIEDPVRGQSEGISNLETTSYIEDMKYVIRNKSYMLSTIGFTCVAFSGALAWWGPKFIYLGSKLQENGATAKQNDVSYKFGLTAILSGLIGVPAGSLLAQSLRPRYPNIDPLICAGGLLVSAPFLYCASVAAKYSTAWCFVFVFVAELSLNLNWAIVVDILCYVIIPTRRGTATAFQILLSHTFGDAGSPYLVGVISEAINAFLKNKHANDTKISTQNSETDLNIQFESLKYALLFMVLFDILGGIMFLLAAIYIVQDKAHAEKFVADSRRQSRRLDANQIHNIAS